MRRTIRLATVSFVVLASGCLKELGRTDVVGEGEHEVTVSLDKAAEVHLNATLEYLRGSAASPYLGEWSLEIETVQGGKVTSSKTCDPLDVALGFMGGQSCKGRNTNCTETSYNTRIANCGIKLEAGESTLRFTTHKKHVTAPELEKLEIVVVR